MRTAQVSANIFSYDNKGTAKEAVAFLRRKKAVDGEYNKADDNNADTDNHGSDMQQNGNDK